jgi:hypothetical protein
MRAILYSLEARHRAECPLCGYAVTEAESESGQPAQPHAVHERHTVPAQDPPPAGLMARLARWWRGG